MENGTCLEKWICETCGYIYDPKKGDTGANISSGTKFEDLPDEWLCPMCASGYDNFDKAE